MSFISYLRQGVNLASGLYNRNNSQYQNQESAHLKSPATIGVYEGRITSKQPTLVNDFLCSRELDDAIEVTTLRPDFKEGKAQFWEGKKTESLTLGISMTALAIGGVALTASGLVGAIPVAYITYGVAAAVLGGIGSAVGYKSAYDASQQQKAWTGDSIQKYQDQRRQLGVVGFDYAYKHKLKGTVAHSQEVQSLWYKNADAIPTKYLTPSNKQIKEFFENNPFESVRLHYAFGDNDQLPHGFDMLMQTYSSLNALYRNGDDDAKARKKVITGRSDTEIQKIENQKKEALAPHNDHYQKCLKALDKKRQDLRREHLGSSQTHNHALRQRGYQQQVMQTQQDPYLQQIEREFKLETENLRQEFENATQPIRDHYDHAIQNWRNWSKHECNQIDNEWDSRAEQLLRENIHMFAVLYGQYTKRDQSENATLPGFSDGEDIN